MKAKPVKRYRTPRYPTKLMIMQDPDLLKKSMGALWVPKKELVGVLALYFSATSGCFYQCGSTGCVVVVPPVYMSEEEAMEVISDEFANHGVVLSQDPSLLSAVELPLEEDAFDLEHRIAVEFITREECELLGGGSVDATHCDFQSVAESLENRVAAERPDINFAILSDPEAHDEEQSRYLLREQVKMFAEWLSAEGVI